MSKQQGEVVLKFDVVLENSGGEIARETCEVKRVHAHMGEFDVNDQVNLLAAEAIEGFVLSLGDVIKIQEHE